MINDPLLDIVVCDVETTGFSSKSDEILSLCIVNGYGEVLFDSYFKPENKTSWESAQKVNNISPSMVKDAPNYRESVKRLQAIFTGKTVLFYNADFDTKFLTEALKHSRKTFCVMKAFASYYREPKSARSSRYNKGKWQWKKLEFAMQHFGLRFKGDPHTAKADTIGTLEVFHRLMQEGRKQTHEHFGEPDMSEVGDFAILSPLAYLDIHQAELLGIIKNQSLDFCFKLLKADYRDPTKVMLCRVLKDKTLEPVFIPR